MMKIIERLNPAVSRNLLLLLAGAVWILVGIMLLSIAGTWLSFISDKSVYLIIAAGVLLALLIHHFGFLKIVDKNLERIFEMKGKKCLFAFIPWKSYAIIAVMITMGRILRSSSLPKQFLAILYIGIGSALILSSIRYLRIFFKEYTGN